VGKATLNVYQPVFGYPLPDERTLRKSELASIWPERAWYLQHFISLNDKLTLAAGIRTSHTTFDGRIPGFSARNLDTRDTSNSFGAVWQATPHWQWFASHTESFNPNTGWDRNHNLFAPEQGVQHETGLRYSRETPAGKPLTASLSAYRIKQKNVTTPDPLDPDYSVLTGAQQVKGVEATLEQPLTRKLHLNAGYSYSDARITSSNDDLAGKHLNNIPRHSASLRLAYKPKANTELTLGAVRVGKRPGNAANTFEVEDYTRLDASAEWKLDKNTILSAGVQNLLDEDYIASSSDIHALVQGRKRSVTLGLEVAF
jgi:iron complex outermembrane receptor protein